MNNIIVKDFIIKRNYLIKLKFKGNYDINLKKLV